LTPFIGNTPGNVNKDAKYSIKRDQGKWVVELLFRLSHLEKTLLATHEHPVLVGMVNLVKENVVGQPGGAFYINEFGQVIVPGAGDYYYAGSYDEVLRFKFEDGIISSAPPANLRPGDHWDGPHVGIPYVLCAGAKDIKYERRSGQRIMTELLSLYAGEAQALALARRLARHKGSDGGRIYINERREFFAPIQGDTHIEYRYLGQLGDDPWFPKPQVTS
jgi:hypothetical protein